MAAQENILVIIDPTAKQQPALARAAWLAERIGARLELFICDYDQYLAGERFFDTNALKKARADLLKRHVARLEKLATPLRNSGIEVTVDAVWDHPLHEGILRKIDAANPSIVFKDTHYHSAIRRSLFSNTDWQVIRDCKPLLWLVKPSDEPAVKTFMAAVDPVHERDKPADLDHKIIETSETFRAAADGELHIVHSFDAAPAYAVSTDAMSFPITAPVSDAISELRSHHESAMDELTKKHGIPAENTHLRDGPTREVLVNAAEELNVDVAVIGAVSRGALERLVLGNTAERVLDFLPCDLLIVKPSQIASD